MKKLVAIMAALFAASAFANSTLNIADAQPSTDNSNPAMQQDSTGSGNNGSNATTQDNGNQNGTDNTATTPSTGNANGNDSGDSDDGDDSSSPQ